MNVWTGRKGDSKRSKRGWACGKEVEVRAVSQGGHERREWGES